jgi:5-methylcytosine-specific restriction endonuclease McrA
MIKRAGILSLNILPELEDHINPKNRKTIKYKEIDGVMVKMSSQRYAVFKKSLVCVKCGISGVFFAIEKPEKPENAKYHLNLYAINKDGKEVLMTKDHIVPKSKGGKNVLTNYQTMCYTCNYEKGNTIEI